MSIDDPSLLQDFLAESAELIETLDVDLVKLEAAGSPEEAQELCNSCFRALHTIKGAASFLGLDAVITFAHAAEDALNKLRKGEISVTEQVMDVLLQSADVVREQIEQLTAGEEASQGPADLIRTLHEIAEDHAEGNESPAPQLADANESATGENADLPGEPIALGPEKMVLPQNLWANSHRATHLGASPSAPQTP